MARQQVMVFWGDAVIDVLVVDRVPHFDAPLTVRVESLEDVELPPAPRRAPIKGATVLSALVHLAALLVLASYAHFRPADAAVEQRERVEKMQGYLGRIAEHDALVPGDVASHEHLGGDDEAFGASLDPAGRALDTHTASLAPLVFEPTGGTLSGVHAGSPSTLGPKLARTPRVAKGRRNGGGGGGGGGAGGASSCVAFAHSPEHDPKTNAWIEFVLEDGAGHPVPNERYRVTLPDGSVHEGLTDKRGLVCFTGIQAGNAKIEFPNVDAKYVGSSPEPI